MSGVTIDENGTRRLPLPTTVDVRQISWRNLFWVVGVHALALLAFVPWFFSWTGVIIGIVSIFVFGQLGISIGYHRMLTHRGFACPKWLERTFVVLGDCTLQDTPARWVAVHRWHHQYTDEQEDAHSPLVTWFWGHVGWVLVDNSEFDRLGIYQRYAKDVLRDPFYRWIEYHYGELILVLGSWALFFLYGFIPGLLLGWSAGEAAQFGLSIMVWGVFVRTVIVWHQTWAVNSFTHMWGYRNYATEDDSRNNFLVGILSHGEGWHNNHHAFPRSVNNSHKWWEIDTSYWIIRGLAAVGLAWDLVLPGEHGITAKGAMQPQAGDGPAPRA